MMNASRRATSGKSVIPLSRSSQEYKVVEKHFTSTVTQHTSNGVTYTPKLTVSKIVKIRNNALWRRYKKGCAEVQACNRGNRNEKLLFHGSPSTKIITKEGFDAQRGRGMFGRGSYFATKSSKSNQYVFTINGCKKHNERSCTKCTRRMLLCRVALGNVFVAPIAECHLTSPPCGYSSVMGKGGHTKTGKRNNVLKYDEYVVYKGEQVYPAFEIEYTMDRQMERPARTGEIDEEDILYDDDDDDDISMTSMLHYLMDDFNHDEGINFEDDVPTISHLISSLQ